MVSPLFRVREPLHEEVSDTAPLVARIRAGDPAAEIELVTRYRRALTTLLRRHLKDRELADDLSQEVFHIAFRSLREGRLHDDGKLAAYLWGIARNLASTERRRRRRMQMAEVTDVHRVASPGPDDLMLSGERTRLLQDAVRGLSPRDREVLSAFYLDEEPKDAICARLNLTPSRFDVIKFRALKRLLAAVRLREGG